MQTLLRIAVFTGLAAAALADDNIVLGWNRAALDAIRVTRTAPPVASRSLAIVHTAMYDAWAASEDDARPVYLKFRGHGGNVRKAISYAALRTLEDQLPTERAAFEAVMRGLGFDPADTSRDPGTAAGIGNLAADAILDFRHHDGANQLGDLHPGAYSDYTGYRPVNTANAMVDPGRWQPLLQPNGQPQTFVLPHWGHVVGFALASGSEFRLGPPPAFGSALDRDRVEQIRRFSAELSDRTKMIAEFWEDGPGTVTPPGHWNQLAQWVVERRELSLEDTVKLFFVMNSAMMDSVIAAWDTKIAYDYSRPVTQIHELFKGQEIECWGGPGLGTLRMPASQFRSYIPTPAFAEYPSGHATSSAAAAESLRLFLGDDRFGASATMAPGSSHIEPGLAPKAAVTLAWATFLDAAVESGLSRRLGGIHFQDADFNGRALGQRVAQKVWAKAAELFHRGDAEDASLR